MNKKQKLIVILGPTASGKSDLAVAIAKRFNGEVISADSRQVYRGMNLGTGKITKKETCGVPHHLLDVTSPRQRFTVAQYKKLAEKAIAKIIRQNKIPIFCGGTGFYIQAVVDDITIPEVKPDLKLRSKLEKLATKNLYKKLQKIDPARSENIDQFNRRRLIRALEIVIKTGQPVPPINNSPQPPLKLRGGSPPLKLRGGWEGLEQKNTLFLGIKKSPEELEKLIRKRLLKRLKQGMIKEVSDLRKNGLSWKRLDSFGLEYQRIAQFLQGKISRAEMIYKIQKDTEHYAKRQLTWFKRDQRIRWVKNKKEAKKLIPSFL